MIAAAASHSQDLKAFVDSVAPRRFLRDPFGLLSGYRAYLVYTNLSAESDEELAELGLSREDLPRVTMDAVFGNCRTAVSSRTAG